MAKRSVLSRPLPNQSQPRNTFDRSFFKRLNWSAGMLLPVFCQFVPAGSSGKINRSIFMRTNAVNTAAFPKLDTHIDFYKVPLKLLMTRYEEFKTNISDVNSTNFTTVGDQVGVTPNSMPYFDIATCYSYFAPGNTNVDECGYPVRHTSKRLLDLLGYNDEYITANASDPTFTMILNSFRLQAYQKVYYDHYRNSAYESNRPRSYNADFAYTQNTNGEWGLNDISNLFRLHYVNYRKDYFMNIYPALNYVVSTPAGTDWMVPSNIGQLLGPFSGSVNIPNGPQLSPDGAVVTGMSSTTVAGGSSLRGVTVQSIRAAFALDKLMRLSAYAPKHVKDQMAARFGLKQHDSAGYESQYLGSFKNDIVIGEVTSTADTVSGGSGAALGAIGGRGVGAEQRGKDIHFEVTADDNDSIIIGVMYTLARSAYDSWRLDAFNFKFTREDIFNPEFMDLGLRPITLKEMYTPVGAYTVAQLNTIIGYVPRDQEYKLGIDENHGLFRDGNLLAPFVNHTNSSSVQRGHTPGTPGVDYSFFKTSPSDLDSLFVQQYSAVQQETDQFFGEINFEFVVRQNMSVHGQPRL